MFYPYAKHKLGFPSWPLPRGKGPLVRKISFASFSNLAKTTKGLSSQVCKLCLLTLFLILFVRTMAKLVTKVRPTDEAFRGYKTKGYQPYAEDFLSALRY